MKMKIIAKLMTVAIAFMTAFAAQAATQAVNGLRWSYEIEYDGAVLTSVSPSPKGAVVVPTVLGGKTVVGIGEELFEDCAGLTSVTIGEGVRWIDEAAFEECVKLEKVVFPSTLEQYEYDVFEGCRSLKEIVVNEGNTFFKSEDGALYNYDKTALYRVPVNVTVFDIPSSVREIAYAAFEWSCLEEITIPDSVEIIGRHAFGYSKNLRRVKLPHDIMYDYGVKGNLFDACPSLVSVETSDGNLVWRDNALYATVGSDVVLVSLPNVQGVYKVDDQVTVIGREAIQHLDYLTAIVFSKNVRQIGEELGNDCPLLDTIVFQRDFVVDDDDYDLFYEDFSTAIVPVGMESRMKGLLKHNGLSGVKVVTWSTETELQNYISALDGSEEGNGAGTQNAPFISAAETFDGYVVNADDSIAGTIQIKAGKPNKKTGVSKLTASVTMLGEKKVSIKGETVDGSATMTSKKDGRVLTVDLAADAMTGSFDGKNIVFTRNIFTAKDDESKATAAAFQKVEGAYVAALLGEDGVGALSIDVKKKGKVKVSGTLPGGVKVSVNTQLMAKEDGSCEIPVVYSKKDASLSMVIKIAVDGNVSVTGYDAAQFSEVKIARHLKDTPDAMLAFSIDVADVAASFAGVADINAALLPDGVTLTQERGKWKVPKAGKVKYKNGVLDISGENHSGLKLSYKAKEGSFNGSFNVYTLVDGKFKKVMASVTGVLVDGVGYGTATIKKIGSWSVTIK